MKIIKKYINPNKIIEATILQNHNNDSEWFLNFVVGYMSNGSPIVITIKKKSESDCEKLLQSFKFLEIS